MVHTITIDNDFIANCCNLVTSEYKHFEVCNNSILGTKDLETTVDLFDDSSFEVESVNMNACHISKKMYYLDHDDNWTYKPLKCCEDYCSPIPRGYRLNGLVGDCMCISKYNDISCVEIRDVKTYKLIATIDRTGYNFSQFIKIADKYYVNLFVDSIHCLVDLEGNSYERTDTITVDSKLYEIIRYLESPGSYLMYRNKDADLCFVNMEDQFDSFYKKGEEPEVMLRVTGDLPFNILTIINNVLYFEISYEEDKVDLYSYQLVRSSKSARK